MKSLLYESDAKMEAVGEALNAVMKDTNVTLLTATLEIPITGSSYPQSGGLLQMVLAALGFTIVILLTFLGNLLVITAVSTERDLRRIQYYLVLSLAVADLSIGLIVMPLAAFYDVNRQWILGAAMCDFWTGMDVLSCTASILHLVAIAVDRYWSITDASYVQRRTPKRICVMIAMVWSTAFVISLGPLLGWKDDDYYNRIHNMQCLLSQDVGYQLFSTAVAFYVPLTFIILLYWKIYAIARRRIKAQRQRRAGIRRPEPRLGVDANRLPAPSSAVELSYSADANGLGEDAEMVSLAMSTPDVDDSGNATPTMTTTLVFSAGDSEIRTGRTNGSNGGSNLIPTLRQKRSLSFSNLPDNASCQSVKSDPYDPPRKNHAHRFRFNRRPKEDQTAKINSSNVLKNWPLVAKKRPKIKLPLTAAAKRAAVEAKRERRAGRTLAIITGLFVACWLPFFVLALYRPLCSYFFCHNGQMELAPPDRIHDATELSDKIALLPPTGGSTATGFNFLKSSSKQTAAALIINASNSASILDESVSSKKTIKRALSSTGQNRKRSMMTSQEQRRGSLLRPRNTSISNSWQPGLSSTTPDLLSSAKSAQNNATESETPQSSAHCCGTPHLLDSALLWLGYVNSALNPMLYTIFSPDFRQAFKRLLGRCLRC